MLGILPEREEGRGRKNACSIEWKGEGGTGPSEGGEGAWVSKVKKKTKRLSIYERPTRGEG